MTNEQTAIFLESLHARISMAIEAASEMMPDDAPRVGRYVHKPGEDRFHVAFCLAVLKPDHFEYKNDGSFLALTPLQDLLDSITADIALLKGEKESV
jgi:hypothetical protein